ncbi:MAG: YggT family protein [Chloroflexota bacterium]|nr:YggT family protein [Chloroflexota bacterium]
MTSMLLGIPPGHGIVYGFILYGVGILILAIFIRVIASWVGFDERNAFIRFLARLTDPFLEPVRRVVRRAGVIDISFLISSFLLGTLQILLLQSLPRGW